MLRDAVSSAPGSKRAALRSLLSALRLGQSVRRAAQFGTFLWVLDAAFTLLEGTQPTTARIWGWVASLGLAVLALVPSVLVLHWVLAGTLEALAVRVSSAFEPRVTAAERHRVGSVNAVLSLAALLLPVAFLVSQHVIITVAQPHFAAILIVAAHGLLMALSLALWPAAHKLWVALVKRIAPSPIGYPMRSGARWIATLLAVASIGVLALLAFFYSTVRLMPWHVIGSLVGALALTIACEWSARVAVGGAARVLRGLGIILLTASCLTGIATALTMDRAPDSARGAMRESLGGGAGHELLTLALDFDRDGYLGMLGGGDCAPFDPSRHPGAIDVPDNRRDEDCDGSDLTRSALLQQPRANWPVPEELPKQLPVILITVDAFSARHMRALSENPKAARDITPQLEAFARGGTLFRSCFSQGPSTRLSFPSIFTSRWDSQIATKLAGRHPYPIETTELMLAELMQQVGYDTVAILSEAYFQPKRWGSLLQGFSQILESPVRVGMLSKHNSRAVTDAAISALRQADKAKAAAPKPDKKGALDAGSKPEKPKTAKPLFLWAHYFDAHPPHNQPSTGPRYGTTQADIYDAELHMVDAEIGRLLREIKKQYGDGALVIITGDHGIGFDSPRHRRLTYGYDLSSVVLHVPLIVRGPLVKPQQLDGLVSTMDIAPTIANLLRVRKRLPFEGASLVPELLEGRVARPQRLYHQFFLEERLWSDRDPLEIASLRTERYNLIHNRLTGVLELYDYRADSLEVHDLIDEPAHAQALASLKQQLSLFTYELHKPKLKPEPKSEGEIP